MRYLVTLLLDFFVNLFKILYFLFQRRGARDGIHCHHRHERQLQLDHGQTHTQGHTLLPSTLIVS
jgi:hypothetical protein